MWETNTIGASFHARLNVALRTDIGLSGAGPMRQKHQVRKGIGGPSLSPHHGSDRRDTCYILS
jgi:hypothetical protein